MAGPPPGLPGAVQPRPASPWQRTAPWRPYPPMRACPRPEREGGPGAGGPVLRLWPLSDHRLQQAGLSALQPPGRVERPASARLGQQVHHQYQHGDELLAGGGVQPLPVPLALLRFAGAHVPPWPRGGPEDVRRPGLCGPPQHRFVGGLRAPGQLHLLHLLDDGRRWMCTHIWERYEYTLDKEFLREHFHLLRDACLFFVDTLIRGRQGPLGGFAHPLPGEPLCPSQRRRGLPVRGLRHGQRDFDRAVPGLHLRL